MLIAAQPFANVVANTLLAALLFLVARLVERARTEQEQTELLAASSPTRLRCANGPRG